MQFDEVSLTEVKEIELGNGLLNHLTVVEVRVSSLMQCKMIP